MELWLFFTIFGSVITIPAGLLFLLLNRFRNTIIVLIKQNGALKKIVINNKTLELGKITKIDGKSVKPIYISKDEIYYGKWRRWIIKPELHSKLETKITDKEVEDYLNNEDLLKLYLAGKFKETLMLLLIGIIACVIIACIINVFLISSHQSVLSQDNSTRDFIINNCKIAVKTVLDNYTGK